MKKMSRVLSLVLAIVLALGTFMASGVDTQAAKKKKAQTPSMSQYAAVFDANYYANKYADLKAAYGNNADALFAHFYNSGMTEGRQGSEEFNVQAYANRYADLKSAFGTDLRKYYMHYITSGKAEGRNGRADAVTATPSQPSNPYANAYDIMISFKGSYPEGMRYTNADFYRWKGGIYYGGYGCAGFAFMLSDAVFGDKPARIHYDLNAIRVGDILRVNNNTHSVIVLKVEGSGLTLAEANYNSSVHWGRTMSWSEVAAKTDYVMTRY